MKNFIDLADWQSEEIHELLNLARFLKEAYQNGGNQPLLKGKALAMIFQKPSLRTRVSFEMGMYHLGGTALMLGPDEIGLGKREAIKDIALALSRYVHGIMARVFAHEHLTEMAQYASVPIINALSDAQHPCQALADILTIQECFGEFSGLRVVFVGDGNNVAASLAQALAHVGANFVSATPPGYELPEGIMADVGELAAKNGGSLEAYHDPLLAVKDADVIYTDTWVSMGQEAQAAQRERDFQAYQVNADLVRHASRRAIVMHCLPAHREHEITNEVMDGGQSVVFDQAENRLHAQKAVLATLMG